MCIGYTPPHWSTPLLVAVPFALLLSGAVFLVSSRFVDRDRAVRYAIGVGFVGWLFFVVMLLPFTGTLQRC